MIALSVARGPLRSGLPPRSDLRHYRRGTYVPLDCSPAGTAARGFFVLGIPARDARAAGPARTANRPPPSYPRAKLRIGSAHTLVRSDAPPPREQIGAGSSGWRAPDLGHSHRTGRPGSGRGAFRRFSPAGTAARAFFIGSR